MSNPDRFTKMAVCTVNTLVVLLQQLPDDQSRDEVLQQLYAKVCKHCGSLLKDPPMNFCTCTMDD